MSSCFLNQQQLTEFTSFIEITDMILNGMNYFSLKEVFDFYLVHIIHTFVITFTINPSQFTKYSHILANKTN